MVTATSPGCTPASRATCPGSAGTSLCSPCPRRDRPPKSPGSAPCFPAGWGERGEAPGGESRVGKSPEPQMTAYNLTIGVSLNAVGPAPKAVSVLDCGTSGAQRGRARLTCRGPRCGHLPAGQGGERWLPGALKECQGDDVTRGSGSGGRPVGGSSSPLPLRDALHSGMGSGPFCTPSPPLLAPASLLDFKCPLQKLTSLWFILIMCPVSLGPLRSSLWG